MDHDPDYMRTALAEAQAAADRGETPVGAVVVNPSTGEVIAAVKNGEPALHTGEIALPWNSGDMNACDTARLKVLDALNTLK